MHITRCLILLVAILSVALWQCDNKTSTPDAATQEGTPPDAPQPDTPNPPPESTPDPAHASCLIQNPPKGIRFPDYSAHKPTIAAHCYGTNHQDIKGVQKVVFLGDSITRGTPPTEEFEFYRWVLTRKLLDKFGQDLEIKECAKWGARIPHLLEKPDEQIATCFPDKIEPKTTLVVMTIGGNDMHQLAKLAVNEGKSFAQVLEEMDRLIGLLRQAIKQLTDPARFPKGVYLLFANVYDFTDGVGDILNCPVSQFGKLDGPWPDMFKTYVAMNERMTGLAVETKTDIIFIQEHFCGHGFHRDDPKNPCYKGPDAAAWFDGTCIHPTPAGHEQIAEMFWQVINE